MSDARPIFSFFGHHKCATQWIKGILADVGSLTNLRVFEVSRIDESDFPSLRDLLDCFRPDLLIYSNAAIAEVRAAGPLRGFHVVRDPRDLVVSAYFSHLHSHPLDTWRGLAEHRRRLRSLDKTEGLLLEMEFSRRVILEMRDWDYTQPDVLEIRMEDLIVKPEYHLARVIEHAGLSRLLRGTRAERLASAMRIALARLRRGTRRLRSRRLSPAPPARFEEASSLDEPRRKDPYLFYPFDGIWARGLRRRSLPPERLPEIIERHRFSAKASGRDPGQEDARDHYRKGVAGDWRNHFGEVHVEAFRRQYNDVLLGLGYETDPHWE